MEITETLELENRQQLRKWFVGNYEDREEIWIVYHKKNSDKKSVTYDEAVEEALCFGWIDSISKKIDEKRYAQRFTPRRTGSPISEINKERMRRLIESGDMKEPGLNALTDEELEDIRNPKPVEIPEDILEELKKDKEVWENFREFPEYYKRIRIGYIEDGRNSVYPDGRSAFKSRLNHFIEKTRQNKRFGTIT